MKDPRIDAYIEKSADFAKPILAHFRNLVHYAFPEIQETIKWGMPSFEWKGIVCGMAAFKAHCVITFMKSDQLNDPEGIFKNVGKTAMGSFGQVKSVADLPCDSYIKDLVLQAVKLNESGIKSSVKKATPKPILVPEELANVLISNKKAAAIFDKLSPTYKREYCDYIAEAKKEETRLRRLEKIMKQLSEGKTLHNKYKDC